MVEGVGVALACARVRGRVQTQVRCVLRDELVVWATPDGVQNGYYPTSLEEEHPEEMPPSGSRAGTWSAPVEYT